MKKVGVNPWNWSKALGYDQGHIVTGEARTLYCAGQTATDAEGKPRHPGDMAAQLALSLDNLEAVLKEADMSLTSIARLTLYTTDVDALFRHYGVLASRLGAAGATPPATLLGVSRLALPELLVEVEAIAVA